MRALCDVEEALVATHHLTRLNGIRLIRPDQDVQFFHIMFSTHEVIWANGLPVESFLVAEQSLNTLPQLDREKVVSRFRGENDMIPAALIPTNKLQKDIAKAYKRGHQTSPECG